MSDTPGVNGKVFDAGAFRLDEDASTEIEIWDPRTKTGTGIYITVMSKDAEKARAVTRGQLNRRFSRMGRARMSGTVMTAEELEAESMDLLVACTRGWRGLMWNGQELPCTAENARMVYNEAPIIREQVDDAISDKALFTRS